MYNLNFIFTYYKNIKRLEYISIETNKLVP